MTFFPITRKQLLLDKGECRVPCGFVRPPADQHVASPCKKELAQCGHWAGAAQGAGAPWNVSDQTGANLCSQSRELSPQSRDTLGSALSPVAKENTLPFLTQQGMSVP